MASALATGTTAGSTQATGSQASAAPSRQVPWLSAARPAAALDFSFTAGTITTAQQQWQPIQLQSNGWLQRIEVVVAATASGNSSTVAFAQDGPFSAIQQFTVSDPGGAQFISPHTGWELYAKQKYGVLVCDAPFSDPKLDPDYSAVTGAGGNGGSFNFRLKVAFSCRNYDAYGALANQDSGRLYRVAGFLGTSAQIYSTPPTTLPSVTVRGQAYFRLQPPQSLAGVPVQQYPAWYTPAGTARVYADKVTPALPGSANASVGVQLNIQGRVLREVVLVLRNSSGARIGVGGDGNYPDPITWVFNNYPDFVLRDADWNESTAEVYGLTGTLDAGGGLDTGVRVLHQFMTANLGKARNNQNGFFWLQTVAGSQVLIQGTWGGSASSLTALVTDIAPGPQAAAMFSPTCN